MSKYVGCVRVLLLFLFVFFLLQVASTRCSTMLRLLCCSTLLKYDYYANMLHIGINASHITKEYTKEGRGLVIGIHFTCFE